MPKKVCEAIVNKNANYLFTVNDSQRAKRKGIEKQFFIHNPKEFTVCDKRHGRLETRTLQFMAVPKYLEEWPGVKQILKMTRICEKKGKTATEVVYGITSLPIEKDNHLKTMNILRNHWYIENRLHWERDMVFDEDRCTIRKGDSPQIMAALRNLLIGLACELNTTVTDIKTMLNGSNMKFAP
ncbi:hypothetical protein FACS1894122_11090 [Alphaproteobacteria bacterium]|nr:hypothetical protein FACS1894122_11090 [Alphaproteobacteria bacterium]